MIPNNHQGLDIQELSIVLVAQTEATTILTPDILRGSGIVPLNWELASAPVLSQDKSWVKFKNGLNIVAQKGTVTFLETLGSKPSAATEVSKIAWKYATTFPNLNFQGVGINPKHIISLDHFPDGGRQFLIQNSLAPELWQNLEDVPTLATLTLNYLLKEGKLRLSINAVNLQLANNQSVPGVMFAGNYHYPIMRGMAEARLQALRKALGNWPRDLDDFRTRINKQFLMQDPVQPTFMPGANCLN